MTDKLPPQWALDKAIEVFGEDEYTGTLHAAARLIVAERERCAKICDEITEGLEAYPWYGLTKIAAARIRKS